MTKPFADLRLGMPSLNPFIVGFEIILLISFSIKYYTLSLTN